MLTTPELAAIQATIAGTLPDPCAITRRTLAPDGQGGQHETWSTIATVACRTAALRRSPRETEVAGRVTSESHWRITLPAGTDVQAKDRLVTGGRTYEVLAPPAPGSYEVERVTTCILIGG